jgi:hypothetical protein
VASEQNAERCCCLLLAAAPELARAAVLVGGVRSNLILSAHVPMLPFAAWRAPNNGRLLVAELSQLWRF